MGWSGILWQRARASSISLGATRLVRRYTTLVQRALWRSAPTDGPGVCLLLSHLHLNADAFPFGRCQPPSPCARTCRRRQRFFYWFLIARIRSRSFRVSLFFPIETE